jgi:putative tryptophan/tyrosine transport system substrate-binding protein
VDTARTEEPPTIGMMRVVPDEDHGEFVEELHRQGWTAGRDVRILPEDPEDLYRDADEAREVLTGWLDDGIDLVVAFSTPFAELTTEIAPGAPVLFMLNDPVAAGLVDDPNQPDGTLTGVSFRVPADRTIDLAAQLLGGMDRLGYLRPADDPAVPGHRSAVVEAVNELGIALEEATFTGPDDVGDAVDRLVAAGVDAVLPANANTTLRSLDAMEEALDRHRLPAIANTDHARFATLVLTPDGTELRRQLARQAARLLSGADVSSVPVEDPRRFVAIVNRSKAEELGLPPLDATVLRQVDVVR